MSDAGELAGKVALVTGGARNIGRAISRALAQARGISLDDQLLEWSRMSK